MGVSPLFKVTERLLDSEEHKLKLLKTEIKVGRHKNKGGDVSQTKVGSIIWTLWTDFIGIVAFLG